MKTILSSALIFTSIFTFAQTDIIEMRSRNANVNKYEHKRISDEYDHISSNFGMLPPDERLSPMGLMYVSNGVLDSVKVVSDGISIMYTSRYCPVRYEPNARFNSLWQPGIDTVYDHPLFKHAHSLDSVKSVLDRDYKFALPSDSTKFIGFDNVKEQVKKDTTDPVKIKRKKNKSDGGLELILLLLIPFGFTAILLKLSMTNTSATD